MVLFSYASSIRFLGLGLLVLLVGVLVNKYFGFVSVGIVISFLGFGIFCFGMFIWLIAWVKQMFSR